VKTRWLENNCFYKFLRNVKILLPCQMNKKYFECYAVKIKASYLNLPTEVKLLWSSQLNIQNIFCSFDKEVKFLHFWEICRNSCSLATLFSLHLIKKWTSSLTFLASNRHLKKSGGVKLKIWPQTSPLCKNFTSLSNEQKIFWMLSCEDQSNLTSVGKFRYDHMP
jgi:hypothetical protein